MKLKLVAVFASVLLLATGAAMAMPGDAPDHAQNGDNAQAGDHDEADDTDDSDADRRRGPPADAPAGAVDAANGSHGPPVDMPGQVPDFVSDVHETIRGHLHGAMDGVESLGERISALTPGDEADADAGNETVTPAP